MLVVLLSDRFWVGLKTWRIAEQPIAKQDILAETASLVFYAVY